MPDGSLTSRPTAPGLLSLPNIITLGRLCAVPMAVWMVLHGLFLSAFWLFAAAGVSDALDGYLARKMNEKTVLGSYIDPIADKLLLLSGFLSLSLMTRLPAAMRIPAWVTIPIISRDVIMNRGGQSFMKLLAKAFRM